MRHFPSAPLARHCTYRIGGTAEIFAPETMAECLALVRSWRAQGQPFWVLGGGANTLFGDGHLPFPVLLTRALDALTIHGLVVEAQAGVWLDRLVALTVRHGLAGLERLSGIPGSVGGAIRMNAGAYGAEVSDHLLEVTVLAPDGGVVRIPKEACGFGYRSAHGLHGALILSARWLLSPQDAAILQGERRTILQRRRQAQPLEYPSAGSVFKRPPGDYASRLVDAAGLKGVRIGGAQVSEKHAGFIVNRGGASAADVLALMALCRRTVANRFGVHLELEQCLCLEHWPQEKDLP